MGETLSLLFRRRNDGSFELQLKEGWSGRGVTGSFVPPYNGRQIKALQKKLNNLDSSTNELRKIGQRLFLALCGSLFLALAATSSYAIPGNFYTMATISCWFRASLH